MSHRINFSFTRINFAIDFFFKHEFTLTLSMLISNTMLKLPPRTIFLPWISFTLSTILTRPERVSSCSDSVLALQILISTNTVSSTVASIKRILPDLTDILFICLVFLDPYQPIATPHECLFPWEKKSSLLNSSLHLISLLIQECLSCRKISQFVVT